MGWREHLEAASAVVAKQLGLRLQLVALELPPLPERPPCNPELLVPDIYAREVSQKERRRQQQQQ